MVGIAIVVGLGSKTDDVDSFELDTLFEAFVVEQAVTTKPTTTRQDKIFILNLTLILKSYQLKYSVAFI
jgi:hypothetical protein